MRIYDIVESRNDVGLSKFNEYISALYEEFDIRPTRTVDSSGKPMGWELFDKDNPARATQTFTGPGAEEQAYNARNSQNARLNAPAANRPTNTPQPDSNVDPKVTREFNNKWRTAWRTTKFAGFIGLLSIGQAANDALREAVYNAYVAKIQNKITEDQYQTFVKRAVGFWVTTHLVPAIAVALRTGGAAVTALIRGIRAWNGARTAISQIASAASGPGFIVTALVNLVIFVLLEVGMGVAARYLKDNEKLQDFVTNLVVNEFTGSFFDAMDMVGQTLGDVITTPFRGDELQFDLERFANMHGPDLSRQRNTDAEGGRLDQAPRVQPAAPSGNNQPAAPSTAPTGSRARALDF